MTGYDIFLSDGALLTTINVKSIDNKNHSSMVLIGQGIPDYGTAIAQDFIWLVENFSKTSAPVNPLQGQQWYDKTHNRMNFYTGSEWRYYAFSESSYSSKFDMSSGATNLDFTSIASTIIFTGSNSAKKYCPTHLVMMPHGAFTASTPAIINLTASTTGDVLSTTTIPIIASTKFIHLPVSQPSAFISGTGTLHLNVTTAATGGPLNYDVYIFGAVF